MIAWLDGRALASSRFDSCTPPAARLPRGAKFEPRALAHQRAPARLSMGDSGVAGNEVEQGERTAQLLGEWRGRARHPVVAINAAA